MLPVCQAGDTYSCVFIFHAHNRPTRHGQVPSLFRFTFAEAEVEVEGEGHSWSHS